MYNSTSQSHIETSLKQMCHKSNPENKHKKVQSVFYRLPKLSYLLICLCIVPSCVDHLSCWNYAPSKYEDRCFWSAGGRVNWCASHWLPPLVTWQRHSWQPIGARQCKQWPGQFTGKCPCFTSLFPSFPLSIFPSFPFDFNRGDLNDIVGVF